MQVNSLLSQHNLKKNLSEQYFYWASKPKCQKAPCSKRGSWVLKAFKHSKKSKEFDIPLEKDCPYKKESIENNETQIPLKENCSDGSVKVQSFKRLKSLDQVVGAIKRNIPVVGGFKLSSNFYKNKGIVTNNTLPSLGANKDDHAKGHAILLVGVMQLPEFQHEDEGEFCLVAVNSWGEGWGRGGYSCLTENWLKAHNPKQYYAFVDRVDVR